MKVRCSSALVSAAALAMAAILTPPLVAAGAPSGRWCGTTRAGLAVSAAVHDDHLRRLERERASLRFAAGEPEAARAGDVAILTDDGTFLTQVNPVDVAQFGIQYAPARRGFTVSASADPILEEIGGRLDLGDDDSRLVAFPRGFRFPFYGRRFTKVFIQSDGNLTFTATEATSTERGLARFLGGPPRIAPLFADLNPATAQGEGGVYVRAERTRFVVTWFEVPEFGKTNRSTFQVVLYANGRITFAFGDLDARAGITGVSPGGLAPLRLIDYRTELPTGVLTSAVAERFADHGGLDDLSVAQAFFRSFADEYDHLIVWLDFPFSLGGAFAYEFTLKNEISGINEPIFDQSLIAGSRGRLRAFVQMGNAARYPLDPHQEFLETNSTLDVLGQEAGHRWGAFVRFRDPSGAASNALLGRDEAHWSSRHNSYASDLEGNEWREDGGGRFTAVAATERYSTLDQYLMGLLKPEFVEPIWFLDDGPEPAAAPEVGIQVLANRVDVALADIVSVEGPRLPVAARAPHTFNMAFVVVVKAGAAITPETLARVEATRAAWELYFAAATGGRGAVNTALRLRRGH